MIISSLELTNFRNYGRKSFEFDPRTSIFIGPNGIGKTNIIEAIYLLATGGSWRTGSTEEMIEFDAEVSHVGGLGVRQLAEEEKKKLQITLTRGFVQGKHTSKILYKLNDVGKHRSDFLGQLKVVLFEPESLEIVIGDPRHRRAFLDEILIQTDPEYARSVLIYHKSLRSRNHLLDLIREGKTNLESLEYWERALVKHGTYIQDKRRDLVEWINENTSGGSGKLGKLGDIRDLKILAEYEPNVISQNRLDLYREKEILAGHTFTGPQRDEIKIQVASHNLPAACLPARQGEAGSQVRDLASFGSRGQQRMAVFQLKLLEARWIEEKTDDGPIILLDDIFSELDAEHEKMVGELIKGKQAIITATELHKGHYPEGKIVELQ